MKPWKDPLNILGRSCVLSFIAVGENNMNTPIRHIRNSKKNGTNLNIIEAMLEIYF